MPQVFRYSFIRLFRRWYRWYRRALDFYERALPNVTDPEVQALFTELRDEEAEHVDMVQKLIAALPPGTEVDQEKDEEEFQAM